MKNNILIQKLIAGAWLFLCCTIILGAGMFGDNTESTWEALLGGAVITAFIGSAIVAANVLFK